MTSPRCSVCQWTLCDDGTCGSCALDRALSRTGAAADSLLTAARNARVVVAEIVKEVSS